MISCFLSLYVCLATGYVKISVTRWLKHYSDSQIMSLRLYGNSRRMIKVIEEHGNSKLKNSSETWREFYKSIDFVMHLVNTGDYLQNISNPVNSIVQKAKYRFNGQFSYFYIQEISKTVELINNMYEIMYFVDEWSLFQFESNYDIANWIKSNEKVFKYMPILKHNFKDLLNYNFKSHILSNFDMDSVDDEYKDVAEESESESEEDDEWG